jgi:4-amino-4-deoxy-L-arabinose transferase-like glycosyltransferase
VLLPQAIEGVGCVALLYACVRRCTGAPAAALLSGTVFALTPVSALVFRYNNPDAMLTLVLLGAGYATLRALDSARPTCWLVLAGALCGLGFLTKMLEALIVVPALALTYAVHGKGSTWTRLGGIACAGVTLVVAAGWWMALVELWPSSTRPFIGGSPTNSVVQLALGYNGLDRLNGTSPAGNGFSASNLARMGRTDLGGEVMWLVPAAIALGVLTWILSRPHMTPAGVRASLTMWTSWFAAGAVTFAGMAGIFHSYYTVILVPPIAGVIGTGAWLAWHERARPMVRHTLCWTTVATVLLAGGNLRALGGSLAWTAVPVVVVGLVAGALLHPRPGLPRVTPLLGAGALVAALAAPGLFTAETARLPHVGAGPMAGPGRGASTSALVAFSSGGYRTVTPDVIGVLGDGAARYTWVAAAMGARSAAAYQVAVGAPVLAIGGYKGTDPLPTLTQFQTLVGDGRIHWLIPDGTLGTSSREIQAWVAARYPSVMVDGRELYDLTAPLSEGTA